MMVNALDIRGRARVVGAWFTGNKGPAHSPLASWEQLQPGRHLARALF